MLRSLRATGERGFTLIELLVVVLIVGILAAVGVPLYLGYVRDARLAEAKSVAGSALTAAQACAQITPGVACNTDSVRGRLSLSAADPGITADGRWSVAVTGITLSTATNQYGGGPITVIGQTGNVAALGARINIAATGNTVECQHAAAGAWQPC